MKRGVLLEDIVRAKDKEMWGKIIDDAYGRSYKIVNIKDRNNLHQREEKERKRNLIEGAIAEGLFLHSLLDHGKKASYGSGLGHDDVLVEQDGIVKNVSVKSSHIDQEPHEILNKMHLASTREEVTDFNVQVFFWGPKNEIKRDRVAIFAWASKSDLERVNFSSYNDRENRERPDPVVKKFRRFKDILPLCDNKEIFLLPPGIKDNDPRWQAGYADGNDENYPNSSDPVYISGWCHGHNETNQCNVKESEAAYWRMIK